MPSDAATEAEGRLFDVELQDVDNHRFHLRWGGAHAAATLAALRHAHREDGPVRQVDWGSYEAVLDGGSARQLLSSVLEGDEWRVQAVEVVDHSGGVAGGPVIDLGAALGMIDDARRYTIVADVY